MSKIIVIPTYYKQAKFFCRMKRSLEKLNYELDIYVYKLSLYLLLKKHKVNVHYIKKSNINNSINKRAMESIEYKIGEMNIAKSNILYSATIYTLKKYADIRNTTAIFIWNGSSVDSIAATDFAKKYNIKTLYFEIANVPNKLFVDKIGTNAKSELYKNINILNEYNPSREEYIVWRKHYLKLKIKNHIVPQKRSIIDSLQIRYFIDIIGYILSGNLFINKSFYKKKFLQLKNNIQHPLHFDRYNYKKRKYIFFPLQVSYDSQIILNSDINLLDAFKKVLKYAKENEYELVIKPHPQECNYTALKEFLIYKDSFILSNDNTFLLMKYAQEVWTINSTVALEALILGKKIRVLGKSFYGLLTEDYLMKYICGYLKNIDFFSNEEITVSQVKSIIKDI